MRIEPQSEQIYDLAVIGGGINGVGIACDAAGRGLSVFLAEKDDLASHTSSASSKLIHGGLRYLEYYEFRLVHESLKEREVLLKKAPHLIHEMRFIMPHRPHLRPAWMIRAGLFLYDHLGKRKFLAGSKGVKFGKDSPLQPHIKQGFEYSDCAVDDARLVVLNALAAKEKGATIATRTRCVSAVKQHDHWRVTLQDGQGQYQIKAKVLVNATGAWVSQFIEDNLKLDSKDGVRWIQGSHIIVPKLYDAENAFILQNSDGRIVFTIPYLGQYTLIGTTDQEYTGDLNRVQISQAEIDYLLQISNEHFKQQLSPADVVNTFSGVRALHDDDADNPSAITRDYALVLSEGAVPVLSVFGGKLTTYRKLAEAVMHKLQPFFPKMAGDWTATAPLAGAENLNSMADLVEEIHQQIPDLAAKTAERIAHAYGTRVWLWLGQATSTQQLGQDFGSGLFAKEVDYLCQHEWATDSEDILWRRSKLGLALTDAQQQTLDAYLQGLEKVA